MKTNFVFFTLFLLSTTKGFSQKCSGATDFSGAYWFSGVPETYYRDRPNGAASITDIVIHITTGNNIRQGLFAASGLDPRKQGDETPNAHYYIGYNEPLIGYTEYPVFQHLILQAVCEKMRARHANNANDYAIGIEHVGMDNDPVWPQSQTIELSANLIKDICRRRGINPLSMYAGKNIDGKSSETSFTLKDALHIRGHNTYPNQTHSCPGNKWDWYKHYRLVNPVKSGDTKTYTASSGEISNLNYAAFENKDYIINPSITSATILEFTKCDLESLSTPSPISGDTTRGADWVYVFEGVGESKTQVSGSPFMGSELLNKKFLSTRGFTISFISDPTIQRSGFACKYSPVIPVETGGNTACTGTSPLNLTSNDIPALANLSDGLKIGSLSFLGRKGKAVIASCFKDLRNYHFTVTGKGLFSYKMDGQAATIELYVGGILISTPNKTYCKTVTACDEFIVKVRGGGQGTLTLSWNGKDNDCNGVDDLSPQPDNSITLRSAGLGIVGNTTLCSGSSTTLTANGGSNATQWYKEGSDGYGVLVHTGKSYTASFNTSTELYVCDPSENSCNKKERISIEVRPGLKVTSNGNPAQNPVVRSGQSVRLTAVGTGTWTWSGSGLSNQAGNTITATPTTTTTYAVSGGTSTCSSASITVIVDNSANGSTGNGSSDGDEACSAKEIGVGNTISMSITSTTTTSNVTPLTCDGTSGRDVWATFIMPKLSGSGAVIVRGIPGTIDDLGMGVYTGTSCNNNNLTFVECVKNGGEVYMPKTALLRSQVAEGKRVYLRFWEKSFPHHKTSCSQKKYILL